MMSSDPERFRGKVQESLRRQVAAINRLTTKGMYFWDYGNAFLLESGRAHADIFAGTEIPPIWRSPTSWRQRFWRS